LRNNLSKLQEGGVTVLFRNGTPVFRVLPSAPQAGKRVTVQYNRKSGPFGKFDITDDNKISMLFGFNGWTAGGKLDMARVPTPASTAAMAPAAAQVSAATVPVPKDAYKMDFVFSDVPGGDGTYDNRGGFDYHLPVEGSPVQEQRLYVCHIAVEMAPIAKVGGLGDVVTALGRAVKEQGHVVEVILPRYDFFLQSSSLRDQMRYETEFDWGGTRIFVSTAIVENLRVFFIEPRNGFFATPTVYGSSSQRRLPAARGDRNNPPARAAGGWAALDGRAAVASPAGCCCPHAAGAFSADICFPKD
ncbi:Soluble starch synthase 3, chloroplastic/amyloplastic, partial [Tetrabaena socialis]